MSSENNFLKIINVFHKKYHQFESDIFLKIQAGAKTAEKDLKMFKDSSGDNISAKNPYYSELTAQYWVWKNYDYQKYNYMGLCHYRRYFAFGLLKDKLINSYRYLKYFYTKIFENNNTNLKTEYNPIITANNFEAEKYLFNFNNKIYSYLENYDIIIPKKIIFKNFSVEEQYIYNHLREDMQLIKEVLLEIHPDYEDSMNKVLACNSLSAYNMFIMCSDIFDEYNQWLFEILFEIEKRAKISFYPYQARLLAFAAERLLNIYIKEKQRRDKAKIGFLDVMFIEE